MIDFDKVLSEVSWRTKDGIVDFTNEEHISILQDVLIEMQIDEAKIKDAIDRIREKKK